MRHSELDQDWADDSDPGIAWPQTAEERVDWFGVRAAFLVLAIAFFIVAIWFVNRPSFGKCSTLQNAAERHACYDNVRDELSKPPAKGAEAPKG
jgi:hypothetical protein